MTRQSHTLLRILLGHGGRSRIHTTPPAHLTIFLFNIPQWSRRLRSLFILVHQNILSTRVRAEVFVDVFECAAGGFGEEEIYDWYEAEVEDGPDDVEAPAESADSDGGDFYDLLLFWS